MSDPPKINQDVICMLIMSTHIHLFSLIFFRPSSFLAPNPLQPAAEQTRKVRLVRRDELLYPLPTYTSPHSTLATMSIVAGVIFAEIIVKAPFVGTSFRFH